MHYYFPATQQPTPTPTSSHAASAEMVLTNDNEGSQSHAMEEQHAPDSQEPATISCVAESGISNQLSVEVVLDVQPNCVNTATVNVHEEPPANNDEIVDIEPDVEPDVPSFIYSDSTVVDGHVSFAQIISSSSVKPEKRVILKKRRMVQHAAVVTSSPYKTQIEEMKRKDVRKKDAKEKSKPKENEKKSSVVKTGRTRPACSRKKKRECSTTETDVIQDGSSMAKKKCKKPASDDCECLYCTELFSVTGGQWMQCVLCSGWAHIECAGISYSTNTFKCDICTP